MRNKLFLKIVFSILCFGAFSQVNAQYSFYWQPEAGSIFGDPDLINFGTEFVSIGDDLPAGVFDLNDVWFQYNDGIWYQALMIHNSSYQKYQITVGNHNFYAINDTNKIVLRVKELSSGDYLYSTALYFYSRPQIAISKVQEENYNPNEPFVLDEGNPFTIDLISWAMDFPKSGREFYGDARIKGLEFSMTPDFVSYNSVTVNPDEWVAFTLNLFDYYSLNQEITYGHNSIYFRSIGEGANDKSDVIEFSFFVFDFSFPQSVFCKYDTLIPLTGLPIGGSFSGDCMVGETMMFNPSLAAGNSTLVTYTYILDRQTFQRSHRIDLLQLPEYEVTGPFQVCGFEHGAIYSLSGNPGLSVLWNINEEVILGHQILSNGDLFVDWGENGTGAITAHVTTEEGCWLEKRQLVDIGVKMAPRDSADLILNDRMLVCSDTSVSYYYWYNATQNSFMGKTEVNYFALNYQPALSDVFFVMTAYDTLGCMTHSRFSSAENALKYLEMKDPATLLVTPNPSSGSFICTLPPSSSALTMNIQAINGVEILNYRYDPSLDLRNVTLDLSGFEPGVYIVTLRSKEVFQYKKVILAK